MLHRVRVKIAVLFAAALFAAPAWGQTDLSKFSLTKGIPADAFIAVATRGNPERQFLKDHWARVWEAFHESGVLTDAWELISDALSDEQTEKIDDLRERFGNLCGAINWDDLLGKEFVHAGRYVTPFTGSPYEGIILGRGDGSKLDANYKALRSILEECVKLIESNGGEGQVSVKETKKDDFTCSVFAPSESPNIGIAVGKWKDVIVFGFGGLGMMEESVKLLQGSGEAKGLITTDRFKQAFAKLPPAEDELVFFDLSNMFGKINGMLNMFAGSKGKEHAKVKSKARPGDKAKVADKKGKTADEDGDDADDPPAKNKKKPSRDADDEDEPQDEDEEPDSDAVGISIVHKVLDELSLFDTIATVEWTDGFRVFRETRSALRADAKSKALYKALTDRPPVNKFERLVPKEAKTFSVGSGVNWVQIYRAARQFFSDNVPEAAEKLEEFDRMQKEEWELDVEKDVFGLLAGGYASIETGNDHVILLQLTDEKKAVAQLDRLFEFVQKQFGQEGGLVVSQIEIAGQPGFRKISHPMMMMMGGGLTPVVGCAESHFIVGTNAKAVRLCLETMSGKHPNITKNARWQKEGLMPKGGGLDSVGFEDQSEMAEQLQAAIGAVSMAMGMVGMFGQDMPPQLKSFLSKLPPIIAKLGPVAGKLDFFESASSYSTYENGVWHEREVQNYKGPRKAEDEDADSAESKDDEAPKAAKKEAPKPKKEAPKPKKAKPQKEDDEENDDE